MTAVEKITFLTMASKHGQIESRIQAAFVEIGDIIQAHETKPEEIPREFLVGLRESLVSLEIRLTKDNSRESLKTAIRRVDEHLSNNI